MSHNYASLLMDAGHYAKNIGFTYLFESFLQRLESRLNRELRLREMKKEVSLSVTEGTARLPDDYLEVCQVKDNQQRRLRRLPLADFSEDRKGYIIATHIIAVSSLSPEKIVLLYYARIPPLNRHNPENWLLAKAPDVYLYGLIEEIALWEQNADKAGAANALLQRAVRQLQMADQREHWAKTPLAIAGPTP